LICINSLNKKNNRIFARIYTQLAKTELGLGKSDAAIVYIKDAMSILYQNQNNNSQKGGIVGGLDLSAAYVVEGDILSAQKNFKEAMESYKKAEKNI
jgi:tetratricopeptide (TPR) repeat protein